MAWILGFFALDGPLILFPGVLWLAFWGLAPARWAGAATAAFLALVVADTGHIYTTLWRTYLRGEERSSSALYWATPLSLVALMTIWFELGWPHAWAFVLYSNLFHHFRQYYGILRWYERLNARTCRASEYFLYALTILPFVVLHFRTDPRLQLVAYFTDRDAFAAPNAALARLGAEAVTALWILWLAFEARLWLRGVREPNRFFAILGPAAVAGLCFLRGFDAPGIIYPMVVNHGAPYFAVMSLSLRRLDPGRYRSLGVAAAVMVGTAVAFGSLEGYGRRFVIIDNAYVHNPIGLWQSVLLGVYLTPQFCHYVFDAVIWTGRHREAKIVYAAGAAAA